MASTGYSSMEAMDEDEAAAPEDAMDEEEDGEMALVPKSVCPDCQPGDVLKFKVAEILEDELKLEYMDKEEGEEDKSETSSEEPEDDMMA